MAAVATLECFNFRAICATMKAAARKAEPPASETDLQQYHQHDGDTFAVVDMAAVGVKAWHRAGISPTTHGRPHDASEIIALATAMTNIVLELLPQKHKHNRASRLVEGAFT